MKTSFLFILSIFASIVMNGCAAGIKRQAKSTDNFLPDKAYKLVWNDEFNVPNNSLPDSSKWLYQTGANGWGNNEIQNYIAGVKDADTCALVSNGTLKIIAKKVGNEVISIRLNSKKSWKYGYFAAKMKLPKGKGTWPAFWMLPPNMKSWPLDGEIDIMENVGYAPDTVYASIHTKSYNHVIGTQKTSPFVTANADTEFHVYSMESTPDEIRSFVDGKLYFTFKNDKTGHLETWPFNKPFLIILNLAWGGGWGGKFGVDNSALPTTFEIDYVRVYQKENDK